MITTMITARIITIVTINCVLELGGVALPVEIAVPMEGKAAVGLLEVPICATKVLGV